MQPPKNWSARTCAYLDLDVRGVATHTLIFLEVALLLPSFPTQPLPHEMATFGPTPHFIALTHSYLNLYITFDLRFL